MVPVNLVGVFPIGPENFMCALFEWEESRRFLPVWLPPIEGALLAARLEDWSPRRPDAHDVLAEVLGQATTGVGSLEISSYHEGVFIATLTLENGTEIDMRTSDALLLALVMDVQIEADETVLQQASMHLTARDARDYFDVELGEEADDVPPEALETEDTSSLNPAEFAEFMRELGVDETDLRGFDDDGDTQR